LKQALFIEAGLPEFSVTGEIIRGLRRYWLRANTMPRQEAVMRLLLFVLGILVATAGIGTSAQAQNYPWCAYYSGGRGGGGTNCGFTSFEQCQGTVIGIGGFCNVNTQYTGPAPVAAAQRRHKPHHS
jgi:hypothetical protein